MLPTVWGYTAPSALTMFSMVAVEHSRLQALVQFVCFFFWWSKVIDTRPARHAALLASFFRLAPARSATPRCRTAAL